MASEDTEWIFPSSSARDGHTTDVRNAFRRVVETAGMNPNEIVPHTLRHTAITHLVQAGIDLATVKRISGHKTLIMVERYAHQNGSHINAAMDKLEQRYGQESGNFNETQLTSMELDDTGSEKVSGTTTPELHNQR